MENSRPSQFGAFDLSKNKKNPKKWRIWNFGIFKNSNFKKLKNLANLESAQKSSGQLQNGINYLSADFIMDEAYRANT